MKSKRDRCPEPLEADPTWYKTGVIYEVHVRAFCDSNGDGIGDFRGLTGKLDYLRDLGVTALWLLPFYPSPLRDDGYDIADYFGIHSSYGTLADFRVFLREAHRRRLRVITELVMNHTSDQHPWFKRARRSKPGSRWREYYVWSDTQDRYRDARIIFKDVEVSNWTWDHEAKAYYWHRFFAHQPDLNFDNPEVFEAMVKVLTFWLELGVDGLRLDAVPYLYEREGTSCENLPETHEALRRLRAEVDARFGDRMLLAEANQWPEDAVAYLGRGKGDECHMAFHFPLMPRLFMAVRMEDRLPIVDILEQTPAIPETAQWALFLRNHDELTLEMVTDEERDYMYRMYAHVHQARLNLGIRRRLAPLLGNDRKRIELLNALLFSLPGTPVLYYGDEIGMGDNIFLGDRNGVRTPMQWSPDKNAGFSRANPQALYLPIIYDPEYHYEAVNVEGHLGNPHSLLWWMRRLLALRKKWRALGAGQCQFLQPENRKILSYILREGRERLLVVANLSRFVQVVELDLSEYDQCVPVELFGRTVFPRITRQPYLLTMGPHSFYWFSLESGPVGVGLGVEAGAGMREVSVCSGGSEVLSGRVLQALESVWPAHLHRQPWYESPGRGVRQVSVSRVLPVEMETGTTGHLVMLQVDHVQGDPEVYCVPLVWSTGEEAARIRTEAADAIVATVEVPGRGTGVVHDGLLSPGFCLTLAAFIEGRRDLEAGTGVIEGWRSSAWKRLAGEAPLPAPVVNRADLRRSSVFYGEKLVLKLFRRLGPGVHPDLEIRRYLTERDFDGVVPLAGALEYREGGGEVQSLAVMSGYVGLGRESWGAALDALGRYYDRIGTLHAKGERVPVMPRDLLEGLGQELSPSLQGLLGTYVETARYLGKHTAALHRVLSLEGEDPAFTVEPFTPHYVRGLYQSMRNALTQQLRLLRRQVAGLGPRDAALASRVLGLEGEILGRYRRLCDRQLRAGRIRIHGNYQLGQVLWTGRSFVSHDFEGEPGTAHSERRIKRSPLRDVVAMMRSFEHAGWAGLEMQVERGSVPPEALEVLRPWMRCWNHAVSGAFWRGYLRAGVGAGVLPESPEDLQVMLQAYLLNRLVSELGQELGREARHVRLPLEGVMAVLGETVVE